MSYSAHYDLKKIYHGLLEKDPDYPAWQDFERSLSDKWIRCGSEQGLWLFGHKYRYNPLPKKREPKDPFGYSLMLSGELTDDDLKKLQAYATKLSWLREQGGYEFKIGHTNFYHSKNKLEQNVAYSESEEPDDDKIYMNEDQAEKWLEMLKDGSV